MNLEKTNNVKRRVCVTCGAPLEPTAALCPRCGAINTGDLAGPTYTKRLTLPWGTYILHPGSPYAFVEIVGRYLGKGATVTVSRNRWLAGLLASLVIFVIILTFFVWAWAVTGSGRFLFEVVVFLAGSILVAYLLQWSLRPPR